MTELFITKAIVKLPRKNNNNNRISSLVVDTGNSNTTTSDYHQQQQKDYLVTDKLYFEGFPSSVTENEMMDLVHSCDPIKIQLNRNNDITSGGYIQFMNRDMADRAYTLLNGVTFQSNSNIRLQWKINNPLQLIDEPEARAGILRIKNLPSHINNKSLYELFRPFGPMILCKIIVEQGSTFKGTALIQYFSIESAQDAELSMNNKPVQDNIITVFPFVSSKLKTSSSSHPIVEPEDLVVARPNRYSNVTTISTPTSPLPPPNNTTHNQMNNINTNSSSPPIRSDGSSMVDYTNLYIKNLDLNVKSADLFNNFRKFGRIISARVMKNAQTKQSKGFGFVSFSKADEAQKAKQEMNGEYILTKPVIVAFHEPKKPRESGNGSPSPTSDSTTTMFNNHHYQQQQQQQQRSSPPPPPVPSSSHHQYSNNNNSLFAENHGGNTNNNNHYGITNGNYYHQQQQNNSKPRDFVDHRYNNNNNIASSTTQKYSNNYNSQHDYPVVMSTNNNRSYQPMERNNSRQSHHNFNHVNNTNGIHDHRQIHISPQSKQQQHYEENHHHTPLKRDLSGSGGSNHNMNHPPSLSALASGAFINTPPPSSSAANNTTTTTTMYYHHHQQPTIVQQQQRTPSPPQHHHHHHQKQQQDRPTFRRRGSVESLASVMTETTSQTRRQTITKAVLAIEKASNEDVHDIVDMLLTLKKKDLATCLFNKVFLKTKIKQAKDALDIFEEQQKRQQKEKDDDDIMVDGYNQNHSYYKEEQVVPSTSLPASQTRYNSIMNNNTIIPPRSSRAIPIVAPPAAPVTPPKKASNPATNHPSDKELDEEIEKFLSSLNGLESHKQKQLLGDRLFPLVKSTGVKQAPRITIRLLDSVPLNELAYSMYDKDKLKHQVNKVVATMSSATTTY